jgi:HD-GYP domain-containing protein (c-di-GMP phosphodiesterase class II)
MELEQLVGEARERELRPMPARERLVAGSLALACVASCALVLAVVPFNHTAEPTVLGGLVLLAAIARRVGFEVGSVEACPEQLVVIPMLFVAPLPLVPLLLAAAYLLARLPEFVSGRMHPDRWLYPVGDALHAVPAVLVLGAMAPGALAVEHADAYLLALAVQIGTGIACGVVGDSVLSIPPLQALRSMVLTYRIDAVLTPIAYMAAAAAVHEPAAVLAILPLLWLLHVFSTERRERVAAALELNQAYRGTVMVLSDVVEAEDNYTASHCRSVVELTTAVAQELGIPERTRQELEIAALLHDVGKIAIPNEILNKPSKLTDEEFALMKTHTVEGQALLNRVGGRLARVGEIVRSCHERWDGRGYPDGLKGEEIPLAARVVFCCDAYSAMTTDRPYRKAMSRDAALEELRRNAGSQFEPRVVEALQRVALRDPLEPESTYNDALRAVLAGSPPQALEVPA